MDSYSPRDIEKKWQERWERKGAFRSGDIKKYKKYILEMFPYPSGKIHMGHVRNYTIGDAIARFHRMKGSALLHPMGWDAFGLPAENAALKHGVHPASWTYENIKQMKTQLKELGFSYDWEREVTTCKPEYYKWNQWIFLRMFQKGIAYRKNAPVNWCPHDETVLANEQVIDGRCWRCGTEVVIKEVPSWFLKITEYADRLLNDLKKLEGKWPDRVITQQRNWIGRSEGAVIKFISEGTEIEVFTTRPDTVFGATFLVLAPEHPLTLELAKRGGTAEKVRKFVERAQKVSRRAGNGKENKEGIFLGVYAINPANNEKIPVWTANYVLYEYGTGAIMAVPAHDQRDWEFASMHDLDIVKVVVPQDKEWNFRNGAYEGQGVLINSGNFSGMESERAKREITKWLEKTGTGKFKVSYKLKDWNISRQRYWGTPIPVIYCDSCGTVPVPEDRLPVMLPENVEFTGKGNPLENNREFINTECPSCGKKARRETDTMDTFFDSSWYFLRYCDPKNDNLPFDPEKVKGWMPVDIYIGGIEHAVLHLLYARFFNKFLKDIGLVDHDEPFENLITQGMVLKKWLSIGNLLKALGLSTESHVEDLLEKLKMEVGK